MPAQSDYRRALGGILNDISVYTVTSATSTSLTLIDLADSTTSASTTRYDGHWVYITTGAGAGHIRRVKTNGFTPSSGALALALSWFAPTTGDVVEISSLFPAIQEVPAEDTSYQQILNTALSMLAVPDRITVSTTGTDDSYPATTWPWLTQARLQQAYEPSPVSTRSVIPCNWRGVRIVESASPAIQIDAPFTGTLTLEVLRPGHTLISGSESTVGFTAEAQTALPSVEDVRTAGEMVAAQIMMTRSIGRPDGANWAARYADARERTMNLRYFDRTVSLPPAPAREAA